MIEIKNLSKQFAGHNVVQDISGTIATNAVVAILGPSGSGKSTLLRCINRLETPSAGYIIIDGQDITAPHTNSQKLRQNVGMVFQNFNLFPHMSVLKNIMYAPRKILKLNKKLAQNQTLELLDKVGLVAKAYSYPHQLSGGQKQRVAIARALAMQPKIMLFDEPTSALDPEMVQDVLRVIKNLVHTQMTMVIVTHEMNFARDVADEIWFLDHGILVEHAVPSLFFNQPATKRARQFLTNMHTKEQTIG